IEEGLARSDGVVWCEPQDHLSATLSRPALLNEEGKVQRIPLLVEEGWREATGWCGVSRRTTCPRHCRVPPSSTRRARFNAFPSSSRRGGAKRRGGGVRSATVQPVRDNCRVLPSSTRRARSNAFPSSSRRG